MINTLSLSRRLEGAGMERAASEEIASALADSLKETGVSKQDLELAIAPIKADLLVMKWGIGVIVASVGSLVAKAFL